MYSHFERWLRSRKNGLDSSIPPIRIVDKDGLSNSVEVSDKEKETASSSSSEKESVLRFGIRVCTNQGLSIYQKNLTSLELLRLVEKLEVLC